MVKAFQAGVFVAVLILHSAYEVFLKRTGCGPQPTFASYIMSGDIFLGLSLAVGALFTVACLHQCFRLHSKAAVAGTVGGTAVVAGVAAAGCFLTGCCGSPMLIVYAGILGLHGLAIPKWLVAVATLISTGAGWWWLTRTSKCGGGNDSC